MDDELSFRGLRALTLALYRERHGEDDPDCSVLRDFMRRAAELEEERNQVMHSLWLAGDFPHTVTRMKTTAKEKHGIRFTFKDMSAEDFTNTAKRIRALTDEILHFHHRLIQERKVINNPFEPFWP